MDSHRRNDRMLASITRIRGTSSRYSRPIVVQIPSGRVGGGGIELDGAAVGSVVGAGVGGLLGLVDGGNVGGRDGAVDGDVDGGWVGPEVLGAAVG